MDASLAPDEREREHRQAAWDALAADTMKIDRPPDVGLLPSFASNFDLGSRMSIRIQSEKLNSVIEKWGLGIHSHIWKKPAAIDAEITVLQIDALDARELLQGAEGHWKTIDRGPGIQIRYVSGCGGDERFTLYEFTIWERFVAYAAIREYQLDSAR
jgi:hypothetical protein